MTLEQITASVTTYFAANYAVATTVQYPNQWIDKEPLDDWVEVYVGRWPRGPQRWTDNIGRLTVEVRCYAKPSLDSYRVHTLATGVRPVMSQTALPIHDYATVGEPQVGVLQFDEGHRDNSGATRQFNESVNTRIRAVTWLFTALAQEL